MKKAEINERFSRAVGAFFEKEDEDLERDQAEITYPNQTAVLKKKELFEDKFEMFKSLLKGFLFFVPGTLFLTAVSFVMTVVFLFGVPGIMSPIIGFRFLSRLLLVLGGGALFSWFGLGELKKPKHLAIPLSTVLTGIVLGILFGLLTIPYPELRRIVFDNSFPFYLLPVGLVVGVLAKNLVESFDQKDSEK
jgi:hypothetical protein